MFNLRHIFFIALTLFIVPHTCEAFFNKQEEDKIGLMKLGDIDEEDIVKILKKIEIFMRDKNVKGVLLLINSPGGSSALSELLFREIKELTKVKPVVSLATDCCESGAYKVASASNLIIALETSSVGAIGSLKTIERRKDRPEIIYAGKYKVMYYPTAPDLTPEQREWAQSRVDQSYKAFCKIVAAQRNLSLDQIDEWADGKCFNGETALQLGLIDQIGGYTDAVQKLRELIEQKGIKLSAELTFVE